MHKIKTCAFAKTNMSKWNQKVVIRAQWRIQTKSELIVSDDVEKFQKKPGTDETD